MIHSINFKELTLLAMGAQSSDQKLIKMFGTNCIQARVMGHAVPLLQLSILNHLYFYWSSSSFSQGNQISNVCFTIQSVTSVLQTKLYQ